MPTSVLGALSRDSTVAAAVAPTGVYEVDQAKVAAASAGTIVLAFTWSGTVYTTASIAFNASSVVVAQAVQGATGPQGQTLPGNCVIATGALASGMTLLFTGAMVGPITGQTITPTGLTGGTATFTRVVNGVAPILPMELRLRGSDGVMYKAAGVGAGDGTTQLEVFVGGSPTIGGIGLGAPTSAWLVGFKDVNGKINTPSMDAAGALTLQSSGTAGTPMPAKIMAMGGTDGTNLRTLGVNSAGAILDQAMGTAGTTAPTLINQIGGPDISGITRPAVFTTNGALSIQDASNVPEAPLSVNGTAFTLSQSGAPAGAMTVNTSSTLLLPDSTGIGSISGQIRGQLEIVNVGNVDIAVSPSLATIWPVFWVIGPGGSLVTTYSGPVSAIQNGTFNGASVGGPSPLLNVIEWG